MVNDLNFEIGLKGKNGGYVDIHAKSDTYKRQQHIEAAPILADKRPLHFVDARNPF